MLEDLLALRMKAKRSLEIHVDPCKKAVLGGRQKKFKISANALYRLTGAYFRETAVHGNMGKHHSLWPEYASANTKSSKF